MNYVRMNALLLAFAATAAVGIPFVSVLAMSPEHFNIPAKHYRTTPYIRRVVPLEVRKKLPATRRDVWQRNRIKPIDRGSGAELLIPTLPESKPKTKTGATLEYWDLNSLQRQEIRDMLRRGGCPEHIKEDMRALCEKLLKNADVPAERPQQFYRGDDR